MVYLSHHATILAVNDLQRSLDFYTQQLGFTCTYTWEKPISYAVLKRDGVSIHLALQDHEVVVPKNVMCYMFCKNVEVMFEELQFRRVHFEEMLNQADYGIKALALVSFCSFFPLISMV